MQAIQTKYFGPTNSKGSRFLAKCDAGRITVSYDHALGIEENHRVAALALALKLGWVREDDSKLCSGALPDGTYAHVFAR